MWVEASVVGLQTTADHPQAHVNHDDDFLTVTALRPIQAGEEVLNYYGPHPNSELLRRYGYVTPKHRRYDVVEIATDTIESCIQRRLDLPPDTWGEIVSLKPPPSSPPSPSPETPTLQHLS